MGTDAVRAVFIADDGGDRDLAVAGHAPLIVGLAQECVHSLQHPLGKARHLPKPYRRAEYQDVSRKDAAAKFGPFVPRPLI